jgi:hypothetical protein
MSSYHRKEQGWIRRKFSAIFAGEEFLFPEKGCTGVNVVISKYALTVTILLKTFVRLVQKFDYASYATRTMGTIAVVFVEHGTV